MTPMRYMLDTDTCSFIIRGGNEGLRTRVQRHAGRLCVSAILAEGCTLVTHNVEHFGRIAGLAVQDWTE